MDSEIFACLTMLETCVSHLRSLEIVTPRSLKCFPSILCVIRLQKKRIRFQEVDHHYLVIQ